VTSRRPCGTIFTATFTNHIATGLLNVLVDPWVSHYSRNEGGYCPGDAKAKIQSHAKPPGNRNDVETKESIEAQRLMSKCRAATTQYTQAARKGNRNDVESRESIESQRIISKCRAGATQCAQAARKDKPKRRRRPSNRERHEYNVQIYGRSHSIQRRLSEERGESNAREPSRPQT